MIPAYNKKSDEDDTRDGSTSSDYHTTPISGVGNNYFGDVIPCHSFILVASSAFRFHQLGVLRHSVKTCSCILPEKCRIIIKYFVKFKKLATKTFQILADAYGDETLPRAYVFEWYKRFSVGGTVLKKMNVLGAQVTLWRGVTLNNHRATSPLVRLAEMKERWETSDHFQGIFAKNWGGTQPNRTITCLLLKATANGRRKSSSLP
ncbi:hypothetical protein TNCV_2823571 [Trichonephila clavipes]|nr:hypothetical protein TNCV_2823571 [Trichonephila clavipes]